jgi:uncharacterized repeat protein (TIGR01451 family)
MQYMDMRLRNEAGEVAAWVRVVEQPDTGSYYRLLNAAEDLVDEGLPGEDRDLVLDDIVTLHLAESSFSGSGLIAEMTPTLTFGPTAIGTYNIEFRVDSKSGDGETTNVQDGDVLGTFTVLPALCEVAIADMTLSGESSGLVDELLLFSTAVSPLDATAPLTYTWTPEPETGQGFPNAAYRFDQAGEYVISVQVSNCGAFAAAVQTVQISSGPDPDLTIIKEGPATSVANQPITYTLTITNNGAAAATNLVVRDILPAGATYIEGGSLVGNEVQWQIPELEGFGQQTSLTFTVSAVVDLVNNDYRLNADGGISIENTDPIHTRIVDAQVELTPINEGTINLTQNGQSSQLSFPGGSVFADTTITFDETDQPATLGNLVFAGRAFKLEAYLDNNLQSDYRLYETVQVSLTYDPSLVAGLNLDKLSLRYWQEDRWQNSGIACATEASAQMVSCTLETPLVTQYVLVEERSILFLPFAINNFTPPEYTAEITGITLDGNQYLVTFETRGFTPQFPGQHVHFFFNSVPPEQAGVPGSGPWYVYDGGSPFTGYAIADRPGEATQLCILVANPDHSVIQGTGNCYDLP